MTVERPASVGAVDSDFVNIRVAAERTGFPEWMIRRWARLGDIGTRRLPRCRPLIRLSDVYRMVETSTRPGSSA